MSGKADEDDGTTDAGSSTDQHVTGQPETGTFLTDQAPTATTPSHGSGNAGVNELGGNHVDRED
jgi:hypothetical protein